MEEEKLYEIEGDLSESINEICDKMALKRNLYLSKYNIKKMYQKFVEEILKKYEFSKLKDEYRNENTNSKYGGIDFKNVEITALIRSTGWELIKQIGKKIISGDFNLTTVSMPIKVMLPLTILQTVARSLFNYPFYFGLASINEDPLEKFKMVIVACVSVFFKSSYFLKPMNPILGETYEMLYEDGSKVYLEQTSHHPPVSHYIMYGPNDSYKYYGYSHFASSAGLNSLKVTNNGRRSVEFKDGTKISYDFCYETFSNSFWGTLRQESLGEINFVDHKNGFTCKINLNSVKKRQSDFLSGDIKLKDKILSKVSGSYISHIEFDGIRYWDVRENYNIKAFEVPNQPLSSALFRTDRILLEQRRLEEGQIEKDRLENIQRCDRKLRGGHK